MPTSTSGARVPDRPKWAFRIAAEIDIVNRAAYGARDTATNDEPLRASSYRWPHAFPRLEAGVDAMLGRRDSNHVHAVAVT
jgi:hypothetical protein